MLIKIKNAPPIKSGDFNFAQYYPDRNYSFSTGVVKQVDDTHVVVDFGDIVIEFKRTGIEFVLDTQSGGEEFFMTFDEGRVIIDFSEHE